MSNYETDLEMPMTDSALKARQNRAAGLCVNGKPHKERPLPPQRSDLEFMLAEIDFMRDYERHRYAVDGAPPPMAFAERAELRRLEIARSNRALGLTGKGKPRVYSTKPLSMSPSAIKARAWIARKREAAKCATA